jgi:hypothetical protein
MSRQDTYVHVCRTNVKARHFSVQSSVGWFWHLSDFSILQTTQTRSAPVTPTLTCTFFQPISTQSTRISLVISSTIDQARLQSEQPRSSILVRAIESYQIPNKGFEHSWDCQGQDNSALEWIYRPKKWSCLSAKAIWSYQVLRTCTLRLRRGMLTGTSSNGETTGIWSLYSAAIFFNLALTSHHEARLTDTQKSIEEGILYNATVGILNASSVPAHNMPSIFWPCLLWTTKVRSITSSSIFNPLTAWKQSRGSWAASTVSIPFLTSRISRDCLTLCYWVCQRLHKLHSNPHLSKLLFDKAAKLSLNYSIFHSKFHYHMHATNSSMNSEPCHQQKLTSNAGTNCLDCGGSKALYDSSCWWC